MIRLGIIGSGFGQYGLWPAFRSVKGCKVVAVCGQRRPQLLAYAKSIGFKNIYRDWKDMLAHEELDAVAIAATPQAQYEIAKVAIAKGLHVFAEKPLATNLKQARELNRLARRAKVTTAVDFLFPEIAEWQKTKSILEQGKLGKLKHVSVDWEFLSYDIAHKKASWKTDASQGGGALAFYFSHGLYYLELFAGRITRLQSSLTHAQESLGGAEVSLDLKLGFRSGVTGDVHVRNNSRHEYHHRLTFTCERGTIILENTQDVVSHFTVKTVVQGKTRKLRIKKDRQRPHEDERVKIVRKLARRFVQACEQQSSMTPSFTEGLRVQALIEQVRLAAK